MKLAHFNNAAKSQLRSKTHSSVRQDREKRIRVSLAIALAIATIALVVLLDLLIASVIWRVICLLCACLMTAAIVFLLPADWRKRLGPATTAFVAAAGALSVFLVNPGSSPSTAAPAVAS